MFLRQPIYTLFPYTTLFRSLQQEAVAGINYYQGLIMHGVINAIVLTTFFAVVFGHVIMGHYLKKEPPKWSYKTSDRKSTRLNSSHVRISYAVFCLKKKT